MVWASCWALMFALAVLIIKSFCVVLAGLLGLHGVDVLGRLVGGM